MTHTRISGRSARSALAPVAAIVLTGMLVFGQDVTEPALKAAFIFNFAKFTEWPADVMPAAAPFVVCVLSDAAIGEALDQATRSRVVAGRKMAVVYVAQAGPHKACHVLYVSGISADQTVQVVAAVRDLPVLTISDINEFTKLGGIAQLFFERGQLRFSINHETAKRARLQLNSMLLSLAKRP